MASILIPLGGADLTTNSTGIVCTTTKYFTGADAKFFRGESVGRNDNPHKGIRYAVGRLIWAR